MDLYARLLKGREQEQRKERRYRSLKKRHPEEYRDLVAEAREQGELF